MSLIHNYVIISVSCVWGCPSMELRLSKHSFYDTAHLYRNFFGGLLVFDKPVDFLVFDMNISYHPRCIVVYVLSQRTFPYFVYSVHQVHLAYLRNGTQECKCGPSGINRTVLMVLCCDSG